MKNETVVIMNGGPRERVFAVGVVKGWKNGFAYVTRTAREPVMKVREPACVPLYGPRLGNGYWFSRHRDVPKGKYAAQVAMLVDYMSSMTTDRVSTEARKLSQVVTHVEADPLAPAAGPVPMLIPCRKTVAA